MIIFNHEVIATDHYYVPCVKKSWLINNFIPYFYECYNMLTHGNVAINFMLRKLGVLK